MGFERPSEISRQNPEDDPAYIAQRIDAVNQMNRKELFDVYSRPEFQSQEQLDIRIDDVADAITARSLDLLKEEGFEPVFEREWNRDEDSQMGEALLKHGERYCRATTVYGQGWGGLYRAPEAIDDPGSDRLVQDFVLEEFRRVTSSKRFLELANRLSAKHLES